MNAAKRILIAPLNWGLGHATRCIPIIDELERAGFEVVLASDGLAYELLNEAYPQLKLYRLPPYNISYHSTNMLWNMAWQWPKILWAIYQEHQAIKGIVAEAGIDIIISDNRYGCYHKTCPSIFMTHQLRIRLPIRWLENGLARMNRWLIGHFDECWIPDMEESPGLAGELSHSNLPASYRYIGPLSRMKCYAKKRKYDAIIVLSGPEPQRTLLEAILLQEARSSSQSFLLVQGLAGQRSHYFDQPNLEVVSFLNAQGLNEAILSADVMICRSGYSSVMDLFSLGKKAILIPTPGQTEQEYLAESLGAAGIFHIEQQDSFELERALAGAKACSGAPVWTFSLGELKNWLSEVNKRTT